MAITAPEETEDVIVAMSEGMCHLPHWQIKRLVLIPDNVQTIDAQAL